MAASFEDVIDEFAQDSSLRIKKLLVYACKNYWESEPYRLDYFDLSSLVLELMQLLPTSAQLEAHLIKVAGTLSKAAEYTLVANMIVHHLKPLYPDEVMTEGAIALSDEILSVATALDHEPEQHRIKKLLYCACRQVWENDPVVLQHVTLGELVAELVAIAPDLQILRDGLVSIVATLNRRNEYMLIAQTVMQTMAVLYTSTPEGAVTEASPMMTQPMHEPMPRGMMSPPMVPMPAPPPPPPPFVVQPAIVSSRPDPSDEDEPTTAATPSTRMIPTDQRTWVDLRLEIMNYCNPLRAKVLLYSALYEPVGAEADIWTVLRSHTLDGLVQQLVARCDRLQDAKHLLRQPLAHLESPDQYRQVASAILRAIRVLYPNDDPFTMDSISAADIAGDRSAYQRVIPHDDEATSPDLRSHSS
ncbi:hypothetical protein ACQ4M4_01440 [Leptolyngbya sp. AN02str]|uniref:hypothetical protein n=1 Tax=Leptolyngbya sp. AN02str TaxID=3423363 RepID=UPI003D32058F